jgi:fatty acid desaturase
MASSAPLLSSDERRPEGKVSDVDDMARLWKIHGHLYDLSSFIKRHPGGTVAITLGRGRDCTALFESYHIFNTKHRLMLQMYAVKPEGRLAAMKSPADPFYAALVKNVGAALEAAGYEKGSGFVATWKRWLWYLTVFCVLSLSWFSYIHGEVLGVLGFPLASWLMGSLGHDGSHFSVSRSPWINHVSAVVGMFFIAGTPMWYHQHVYAHHSHTNEADADPDMYHMEWFRVNEKIEHRKVHRLQACRIYAWIFWSLSAFGDAVAIPIESLFTQKVSNTTPIITGGIGAGSSLGGAHYYLATLTHTVLYIIIVGMPLYTVGLRWGWVPALVHILISGWLFGFFSQINHFNDAAHAGASALDGSGMLKSWSMRQVESSTNWASNSTFWTMLANNLNYQIEHHLFPGMNPQYYHIIKPAVQATSEEFGVRYNNLPTFCAALSATAAFYTRMSEPNSDKLDDTDECILSTTL